MNILITDFISKINLGEVQNFKNLQIIPLFTEGEEGLLYLTLKEALEKRLLVVKEVSADASVPELMVINNADVPVFLMDREEIYFPWTGLDFRFEGKNKVGSALVVEKEIIHMAFLR